MCSKDVSLLSQFKQGSEQAFNEIYLQYAPLVRMRAFSIVHNDEDAEDIKQEVFTKFWQIREQLDENMDIKLYLLKATKNRCLDYLRKVERMSRYIDSKVYEEMIYVNGQTALESKEMMDLLHRALEKVRPPACKRILKLFLLDDMSYEEIADELNITIGVARNQVYRARKCLRLIFSCSGGFHP
jgi:RNA polymerase sigma-70 factor (family 1)